MHGRNHVRAVPGALLDDVERGHPDHLGAVHVGVQHLGTERNQPISKQLCRALVVLIFNHLGGVPKALQAGHGAAVRERDDVGLVPRWIKAQDGTHHTLLCATVGPCGQQLHHAQTCAVGKRTFRRAAAAVLASFWLRHAALTLVAP